MEEQPRISFTDTEDNMNEYSYPWETEPTENPLQVAQEELNQFVQSPDGWVRSEAYSWMSR